MRAPDRGEWNFTADRPDGLWGHRFDLRADPVGHGLCVFDIDAFSRRIVGWRVAANMKTEMVLDALEMARVARRRPPVDRVGGALRRWPSSPVSVMVSG